MNTVSGEAAFTAWLGKVELLYSNWPNPVRVQNLRLKGDSAKLLRIVTNIQDFK